MRLATDVFPMSHLRLNLDSLLRFYDDSLESRLHQSSLKSLAGEEVGLALFEHFLVGELDRDPVRLEVPCTVKGARLDGWVKITRPESVLYQVEVKSWSMHSYGHKRQRLPIDATTEEVRAYKIETWKHYWDEKRGSFKEPSLNKVLIPMKVPPSESGPVEPVACLWSAVHPYGFEAPFFQIGLSHRLDAPVKDGAFHKVNVFSASAYLRHLRRTGIARIRLELPNTKTRMSYLNSMFSE
jgi:hypothetical protein